jgi:uncharacterized protein YbgA (DUF1722 family)
VLRARRLFDGRWSVGDLVRFHTAEKLLLMAHSVDGYQALGRLVAEARGLKPAELRERYEAGLQKALAVEPTPGKHANVLQHMLGYFSDELRADDRAELVRAIDAHRRGRVPLHVPLGLMRRYVKRHDVTYLEGQTYLRGSRA